MPAIDHLGASPRTTEASHTGTSAPTEKTAHHASHEAAYNSTDTISNSTEFGNGLGIVSHKGSGVGGHGGGGGHGEGGGRTGGKSGAHGGFIAGGGHAHNAAPLHSAPSQTTQNMALVVALDHVTGGYALKTAGKIFNAAFGSSKPKIG